MRVLLQLPGGGLLGSLEQLLFQAIAHLVVTLIRQRGQRLTDDPQLPGRDPAGTAGAHASGVGDPGIVKASAGLPGRQTQAAGEHLAVVDEAHLTGGARFPGRGHDPGLGRADPALGLFERDELGVQLHRGGVGPVAL